MRRPIVTLAAAVLTTGALGAACSSSSSASMSACGGAQHERLDPAAFVHSLPGGPEPSYLSDPPTSGPHDPRPVDAVQTEPLTRPRQVGQLEGGSVVVQWDGLDDDDRAAVEALAGDRVVVAPNPDLAGTVVATAWTVKLACPGVDQDTLGALEAFIDEYAGTGPGDAGHE